MALDVQIGTEELRLLLEAGYLATERREFGKAKEIFEGVQAIGRGVDVAETGLANLHLVQGNQKDAEKLLRQALKTNPKNAYATALLGELLHTLGKKDEALAALNQAKQLDPGASAAMASAVEAAVNENVAYDYKTKTKKK
ncbi:MAG TPA: tetratricopeptide repeat protein [Planctomycetota bacterium]|nr:tetratricopeptide repeat protein [Planctomycetota bacterium]